MRSIIAYYSIFIGISVLVMWVFILLTGNIQEGKKEMMFHLFAELLMAALCILSGFLLLKKGQKILNVAAHSMIVYSVINAAGYYFEKNEFLVTLMFLILFLISVMILITNFLSDYSTKDRNLE